MSITRFLARSVVLTPHSPLSIASFRACAFSVPLLTLRRMSLFLVFLMSTTAPMGLTAAFIAFKVSAKNLPSTLTRTASCYPRFPFSRNAVVELPLVPLTLSKISLIERDLGLCFCEDKAKDPPQGSAQSPVQVKQGNLGPPCLGNPQSDFFCCSDDAP